MAIPTWTAGEVLASSDVNEWFVPLFAYKTANETRASTTTLANDADVTIPSLVANAVYEFCGELIYDGGAGASETDFKFKFTIPASAGFAYSYAYRHTDGAVRMAGGSANDTFTVGSNGVGTVYSVHVRGMLFMASSTGAMTLQWAQGTSGSTNTKLYKGSYLKMQRVG